jgi:hypothetical protein
MLFLYYGILILFKNPYLESAQYVHMKTKIIISLVSLLFFSQKMIGQIDNSLFDEISVEQETQNLLPSSMIFTQRLLWGEKGLMRTTKILPLNIENREKELKIRRRMLKTHQVIGYAAQGILGTKLYNGQYELYKTHKMIGNITTASYFTGAGLSLFAPPPLISRKDKGLNSIKAHKWLATVHFSAMIATNLLAESEKKYHRAAAFTLFGSYALAVVSFKF